jgi:Fe-S-cluster-containing dehydrogenase component
MRIDRYYSSNAHKSDFDEKGKLATYAAMEDPSDNPQVVFQPMMCQHCNHAPCETVCPVLATTHSSEGLNQMTYNRCVGTRYCANNCPYKVRRFNWFSYYSNEKFEDVNGHMFTDLGRMVLNPDVTVRARGVMEKCSFCVQRIQLGKLEAKKQKRRPLDGEVVTACAQSCPTEAILFGDMRDPNSRISKLLKREDGERAFHVLDSINVQPNVTYLTKIRNVEKSAFFPEETPA